MLQVWEQLQSKEVDLFDPGAVLNQLRTPKPKPTRPRTLDDLIKDVRAITGGRPTRMVSINKKGTSW